MGRVWGRGLMLTAMGLKRPLEEMLIPRPGSFFGPSPRCSSLLVCLPPLVHFVLECDPLRRREIVETCHGEAFFPIPDVLDAWPRDGS